MKISLAPDSTSMKANKINEHDVRLRFILELVCRSLSFEVLIQLAATTTRIKSVALTCCTVPVHYTDNMGNVRELLQVTPWETQSTVSAMIQRFTNTWRAHAVWHASGWRCLDMDYIFVQGGSRWSQTGLGLNVVAIGLLRMYDTRSGTITLRDGADLTVTMIDPLPDWAAYNQRVGGRQGDWVEASGFWSGNILAITELDDLPSTLSSGSDDRNAVSVEGATGFRQ